MASIIVNKRTWRAAALILLLVAMIGPWTYDLISVPAQYTCDWPNVRLQGDFCGLPLSILWAGPGAILGAIVAAFTTNIAPGTWFPQVLVMLTMIFIFVPPLTLLVLLRRGEQDRWQSLNVLVLILAATGAAAYLILQLPRPYGPPWGALLYVIVVLSLLALELFWRTRSKYMVQA
jgi:hypothetical protein